MTRRLTSPNIDYTQTVNQQQVPYVPQHRGSVSFNKFLIQNDNFAVESSLTQTFLIKTGSTRTKLISSATQERVPLKSHPAPERHSDAWR